MEHTVQITIPQRRFLWWVYQEKEQEIDVTTALLIRHTNYTGKYVKGKACDDMIVELTDKFLNEFNIASERWKQRHNKA